MRASPSLLFLLRSVRRLVARSGEGPDEPDGAKLIR